MHTLHMPKPVITFVCYGVDGFGADFRVQSATGWTATVHTLHMPKPAITFVFNVLQKGLLRPQPCASVGFDKIQDDSPDSQTSNTAQPRVHTPRGRLQIFHWNAGALSQSKYHEVLHWCHLNWIDIVILTETHWTFEDEWMTPKLSYHTLRTSQFFSV